MESKAIGLLRKFESIRIRAQHIYESFEQLDDMLTKAYFVITPNLMLVRSRVNEAQTNKIVETQMILDEYRKSSADVYDVTKTNLSYIADFSKAEEAKGVLHRIVIECDRLIGFLNSSIAPISAEDLDKLSKLRTELSDVTTALNVNYEKNLIEAISEHEKGHYLASALITARVINYAFDQVNGHSIEDKIRFLQDQNMIKKGEKGKTEEEEFIMKASKKARNVFSHEIKIFANPSDSLSMLGDCVRLLRTLGKLLHSL